MSCGNGGTGGTDLVSKAFKPAPPPKPAESAYNDKTEKMNYRKAMLNGYPKDMLTQISGRVTQIIDDTNLMIATRKKEYIGYIDNIVLVTFDEKQQVLEGDIVRVYGRYQGTQKYTTVLRAEAEVPLILGDYLKILRQKSE
jgi:ribosomal protein L35AE/L33A